MNDYVEIINSANLSKVAAFIIANLGLDYEQDMDSITVYEIEDREIKKLRDF